jgi:hypothetical protein
MEPTPYYDQIINGLFWVCVKVMYYIAEPLGMTYKAINIWIFVIIWPIFTVWLIGYVLYLRRKLANLT